MDRELTPAELAELLPAYALDAVDDDERAAVEAHLAVDPDARDEVASLQRAASFLAHAGGPPPVGVWEKLEATIRVTPGPSGEVPPPRLLPVSQPRRATVAGVASLAGSRRGGGRRRARDVLALGDRPRRVGPDRRRRRGRARRDVGAGRAAHHRCATPTAPRWRAAVVLPDGSGYLTSAKLPALDRDRTYQLWGVDDHATISLGVHGRDPKVVAFHTDRPPTALAITNERAGGVVSSAEAPTAVGKF